MIERNRWLQAAQVCLLLLGAWLLFHWWRERPPVVMSDDAVDDLIEEVGDTYVPVHVGQIQRGTLRHYVTAYGIVAPAVASAGKEAANADIASPMTAAVASVQCVEGKLIAKGATLFTMDSRAADLAMAHAEQLLDADRAAVAKIVEPQATTQPTTMATTTTSPSMDALPAWRLAEEQRQVAVDAAELHRLQEERKLLTIAAPIAGTVTNLNIAAGETTGPGKVAVQLVDLNRLVATVDVPAENLSDLKVGQTASIDLRSANPTTEPSNNSGEVGGTVVLIDPTINPSTGMGSADIALPAQSGLRPGQFVRAQIVTGEENDRLMVPTQSITQNKNGDPAVGLVETDGRWAVLVPVTTGWRDGDQTEIEGQGLDAGEQVVTIGANGLVQRTRLYLLRD